MTTPLTTNQRNEFTVLINSWIKRADILEARALEVESIGDLSHVVERLDARNSELRRVARELQNVIDSQKVPE